MRLRIGLLAPIAWRVPPRAYDPWELVVSHLAEGLVERGHEVVPFATGNSETKARLVWVAPRPLGEDPSLPPRVYETLHLGQALALAGEVDLLHNHFNYHPLPFTPHLRTPVVTTLHGAALLEPETRLVYRRFRHLPYVSISQAERQGLPELNYVATVYNGIRLQDFTFRERPGSYLAYLGRICPEKGVHHALEVARRTGLPLLLAGPIPPKDQAFLRRWSGPGSGRARPSTWATWPLRSGMSS